MRMIRVTPAIDSDVSGVWLNPRLILGVMEHESNDGYIASVIIGITLEGGMESLNVRESADELITMLEAAE